METPKPYSIYETRLEQCRKTIMHELTLNNGCVATSTFKYLVLNQGFPIATYQRALKSLADEKRIFTRRGSLQYVVLLENHSEAYNAQTK